MERAAAVIKDFFCGPILVLRDKMDCGVEFVNFFFVRALSFPWQHGTWQQGGYTQQTVDQTYSNVHFVS